MTDSPQPLIGRVRHARVPAFVFGTRLPESAVPRFGSLVRTRLRALDITVYGLVYDIEVNADDAGTTRLLSIELGLGNGFLRNELEIALVEDFRQVQRGNLVLAAGLLHIVVEHQQQLAGLDRVTGIEIQRGNLAAGFRTKIDPAHGLDGADRIQVMAPGFAGCERRRDGHRRRREIRAGRAVAGISTPHWVNNAITI